MTATIATTAVPAPLAGAASLVGGVAAQGAAATGFDALLASLFGGGEPEAATNLSESLFGAAPAAVSDDEQLMLEGEDEVATPAASADAQALVALLSIPAAAPPAIPVEPSADAQDPAGGGQRAAAFAPVAPQDAMAPAPSLIAQPQASAAAPVDTEVAQAPASAPLAATGDAPAVQDAAQDASTTVAEATETKASATPAQPAHILQPAKPHVEAPHHINAPAPAPKPVEAPVAPAAEVAQPVLAEAAAEAAPAPAAPPAKERPTRSARAQLAPDGAPTQAAQAAAPAAVHAEQAAAPAAAAQPAHEGSAEPKLEIEPAAVEAAPEDAKPAEADAPEPQSAPTQAAGAAEQSRAPTHSAVVRGSPETVAQLSAQILKKLEARSTRFDLELNPVNLGRVDVRIEIGAHGRMSAAMTFDNPQAAQELRSKAHELQRALEQAGFDLSGGVTFDVAQDRSQHQGHGLAQQQQDAAPWRGRAFQAALNTAGEADVAAGPQPYLERRASGVDVRI